jgi:hypothetical protein
MSFEALKAQQSEAWGSAPWEPMAARLAAIHDHLVARLAAGRDERWLDVAREPARSHCAQRARELA